MLKINLLPPYIYERRQVRRTAFLFGLLFAALVVGMLAWWVVLSNTERHVKVQRDDMAQKAAIVDAINQDIAAEEAKIPLIEQRIAFIEGIMDYNKKCPELYGELARYTYKRIRYTAVQPSSAQLSISARAKSVGDCGRYLLNMYRAKHIFSTVVISSGVPGWPPGTQASGGMPGSMMGPMGPAGPMPMAPMAMPGMPGMPGGSTVSADSRGGFDFTVACTLVEPIYPPSYGGAAAGMMQGQMPGMMPGMMPGGMPGPMPGPMPGMPPAPPTAGGGVPPPPGYVNP